MNRINEVILLSRFSSLAVYSRVHKTSPTESKLHLSHKVSRQTTRAIFGTYSSSFTRSSAALTTTERFITTANLHIFNVIKRILDTWPNRGPACILYIVHNFSYSTTDTQTSRTRICTPDKEGGHWQRAPPKLIDCYTTYPQNAQSWLKYGKYTILAHIIYN
jgi:hypothetical protein